MSPLDAIFRLIFHNGEELPRYEAINFVGDGVSFDEETKQVTVTIPDPATPVEPLSTAFYVDLGTELAAEDQNGAGSLPYSTVVAAEAAAPAGGAIILAPGDYSGETLPELDQALSIAGMVPNTETAAKVTLPALSVAAVSLVLTALTVGAITGTGALALRDVVLTDDVACASLAARDCAIESEAIDVSGGGGVVEFTNTTFFAGTVITFTGDPGWVTFDPYSYGQFVNAGGSIVNGDPYPLSAIAYGDEVTGAAFGDGIVQLFDQLSSTMTLNVDTSPSNEYGSVDLVSRTGNIASGQPIISTPARGLYLVSVHVRVKTAGTAGSLVVEIGYTTRNGAGGATMSTTGLNINAPGERSQVFAIAMDVGASNFFFTTSGVGTAGALSYDVNVTAQRIATINAG